MIELVVNHTAYPLPVQTAALQCALDGLYDRGRLSELVNPHAFLAGAIDSDWPSPPETDWPRPRLGSIYWPVVGLAHYAFACLLVDEYTLGQIRAGMLSAGTNDVLVKLTDDPTDDTETARTVAMQFLATRPLVRTTNTALTQDDDGLTPVDGWVLILVDDRYRLLHTSVTSLTTTAWSNVFAAASITITDATDSDYLTPGARWSTDKIAGKSLAWLMDIAALSVGSRIVTVPGSAPALQRPTATHKTALATAHTNTGDRFLGGGPIADADIAPGQPNDVRVIFGGPTETTPVNVDVTVQTTYAWSATAYLTHWCDAPASTSGGNRSALAAQFEADWSAWQLGCYDTTYSGFVAAPATGFCWAVEWYHDAETGYTKFVRSPHWHGYLLAPQQGSTGSSPTPVADAWKTPGVRAATTTTLPANTYANGSSGVGATLTGNANGALSAQDGVTLVASEDLLVKDEASGLKKGIYTLTQVGDGSHPYILTRRTDTDEASEILSAVVSVQEGTLNADSVWLCTANATIVVGTTALPWAKIGQSGTITGSGTDLHAAIWDGTGTTKLKDSPLKVSPTGAIGDEHTSYQFFSGSTLGPTYGPGVTIEVDSFVASGPSFPSIILGASGQPFFSMNTSQLIWDTDGSSHGPTLISSYTSSPNRSYLTLQGISGIAEGVMQSARFDVYSGSGSTYTPGVGGSIGPGATAAGGIITSVGIAGFTGSGTIVFGGSTKTMTVVNGFITDIS